MVQFKCTNVLTLDLYAGIILWLKPNLGEVKQNFEYVVGKLENWSGRLNLITLISWYKGHL